MHSYINHHDCPFEAFIASIPQYNAGRLVGEWVRFPTTLETLQDVFKRIGVGSIEHMSIVDETWFITDYQIFVDGIRADKLGKCANLDELNYLASLIDKMDSYGYEKYCATLCAGNPAGISDMIDLTFNLEEYAFIPGAKNDYDLGRHYIDDLGCLEIPAELKKYFDYAAYGREVRLSQGGKFSRYGYAAHLEKDYLSYIAQREGIAIELSESFDPDHLREDSITELLRGTDWVCRKVDVNFVGAIDVYLTGAYSPEGRDMSLDLRVRDRSIEALIEAVKEEADSFDVEDEVKIWIPNLGRGGCPESIEALLSDCKAQKEMLLELHHILEERGNVARLRYEERSLMKNEKDTKAPEETGLVL